MAEFQVQLSKIIRVYKLVLVKANDKTQASKRALQTDDGDGYCDEESTGRRHVESIEPLWDDGM